MAGRPGSQASRPLRRAGPLCAALALLCAAPGRAEPVEASSPGFTIYADARPAAVRDLAGRLERFRLALDGVLGGAGPGLPLTIYIARSRDDVRQLYGDPQGARHALGFYLARSEGPLAVLAPEALRGAEGYRLVLHEYVHHALAIRGRGGLPGWVGEGAAEYYGAAQVGADGTVTLGGANPRRLAELRHLPALPASVLMADAGQREGLVDARAEGAFYAKSWLLYRYLDRAPQRRGQLDAYLAALDRGTAPGDAARAAFGDLDELDRAAGAAIVDAGAIGPVAVVAADPVLRRLTPGERAVLPLVLRARAGAMPAAGALDRARRLAARDPQDSALLAALAELESGAGTDARALALADQALVSDPGRGDALRVRALVLMRGAQAGAAAAAAQWLRAAPDDPLALASGFRQQVQAGQLPDAGMAARLARAVRLAPWDAALRLDLADWQVRAGWIAAARITLAPLARGQAGGAPGQLARARMAALDSETAAAATATLARAAVR